MNLIDENIEKESEEKQKKVTKIIIIAIAVLVALVVLILVYSMIKKKNTITVSVNDEKKAFNSSLFLMSDKKHFKKSDSGEIYISVRELSNLLKSDVAFFNDEYKGKGEDVTKCHIKTDNEYTSYISGSSTIYKVRDNKAENDEIRKTLQSNNNNNNKQELLLSDYEYEYFNIDGGVIYENNEIYATQSAIELGFNIRVSFDEKSKTVKFYTLDGLKNVAVGVIGDTVVKDDIAYYNKKLLKYGYALVKSSSGDYGIQDYNSYQEGNYVLSCKYSDIKFVEGLNCLIVTTSEKKEKGILKLDVNTANVITLVDPVYQEIQQIAEDGSLYLIKQSDKYGLLKITDDKAETVLKCEYQTIGIDNYSDYEEMENRYLIDEKYIPIKRDNKWGVATIDGKLSIVPQYDKIGCNIGEGGKAAICVPKLKNGVAAIIFGSLPVNPDPNAQINNNNNNNNDNAVSYVYSLVNAETKQKIGFDAAEIYSTTINNEREYIMKIVATDGSTHRINIYDAYSEPARAKKTNATSATEAAGNNNNTTNTNNVTNTITTTTTNN